MIHVLRDLLALTAVVGFCTFIITVAGIVA